MLKTTFVALFTIITILGSMLIILAISLQFGKDLWHAPEDAVMASAFSWTLSLTIHQRFGIFCVGFICIFFLIIDTAFIFFMLCTLPFKHLPLKHPITYRRYNSDIECPSFGSPQSKSTPIKKDPLPVVPAIPLKNALFHTENEKSKIYSSTKQKVKSSSSALLEKKEAKNEEIKLQIDGEVCVGKYWTPITTIAEVHDVPEEFKPSKFISVPSNAQQMGISDEMQKVLGQEVDEIISESDSESSLNSSSPYLFIKSKQDHNNTESLLEAILYSKSEERLCI